MTNTTLECGTIPKGTEVKIDGCPFVLQEDVPVVADQKIVDLAIKNQTDFYNGVGVVGWGVEDCLRDMKTGKCQVHGENSAQSTCKAINAENLNSVDDLQILEKLRVLSSFASSHLCVGFDDFRHKVEAKAEELINKL